MARADMAIAQMRKPYTECIMHGYPCVPSQNGMSIALNYEGMQLPLQIHW